MTVKTTVPTGTVRTNRVWQIEPKDIKEDDLGYVLVSGIIARAGVMVYRADELFEVLPDGVNASDTYELHTDPDEVYTSAGGFEGMPLTMEHPPFAELPLTASTRGKYEQGVLSHVNYDDTGRTIWATIRVHGEAAKAGLLSGEYRELSTGVTSTVELGEDGRLYEKNIRGDHVALVKRGRCGAECAVKYSINQQPDEVQTVKVDLLNGTTVELGDSEAQLVQAAISLHTNAVSESQGRVAGLEASVTTLKANQADDSRIHALAVARAGLLRRLPDADQDCECSNLELKRKVATNAGLTVPEGVSEAFLDGMLAVVPTKQNSPVASQVFKANSAHPTQTYEEQMAAKAKFKGVK